MMIFLIFFVLLTERAIAQAQAANSACVATDIYNQQVNGICFDASLSMYCATLNMTIATTSNCPFSQQCCYLPNTGIYQTTQSPYWTPFPPFTTPFPPFPGANQVCGVSLQNANGGGIGGGIGGGGISPRDSSAAMAKPERYARIIGGNNVVDMNRYCWIAAIYAGNTYIASGAIVNGGWVITSANAVRLYANQIPGSILTVRLGQVSLNTPSGAQYQVVRVILHPGYRIVAPGFPVGDVGLLQLGNPIDFNANPTLCTVCLPDPGSTFIGERCHSAGYGVTQENANTIDGQLRDVLLPLIPKPVCDVVYRRLLNNNAYTTDPTSLCAGGEPGKDTCLKDGGAPFTCIGVIRQFYVLAGLSSWGTGCGRYGTPSVYADISNPTSLSWIQSVVGPTPPRPQTGIRLPIAKK